MPVSENRTVPTAGSKTEDAHGPDEEYTYQTAGIRERDGYVPLWLILVGVGLLIWSGYYLWAYWLPPVG
ncbi:hypothetical protein [Nitrospina gracilis]|uniref:hypothetical protein n=1 Tax=Nitrospina gracilis TaxID=35801 RepID=UPI001F31FE16|nr:hypothetical protein [Nitrospina gracilis]MCF8721807.1 hypothetical protein [Nitrospina gracilis Nb-211]